MPSPAPAGREWPGWREPATVFQIRPTSAMSRGLLAAVTVGIMAGVAACGGVVAGSHSHPAAASGSAAPGAAPLCANTANPDRLVVSLSSGIATSHVHQVLPAGLTISDPARVRAVATALCGLPTMAHTQVQCPADFGSAYRLAFFAAGRPFPLVVAKTTGCRSVSGLGPAKATSGSFWSLLRREIGTSHGAGGAPSS